MRPRPIACLLSLAAILAVALYADAGAERFQRGNLIVAINGAVHPNKLPRKVSAPVDFEIDGRILTADRSPLPRLTKIELTIAGSGTLDTRGLPGCRRAQIANATNRQALRRCPGALVGDGRIAAEIVAPHQAPFPLDARLLAFNGRGPHGEHAVWVHAYTPDPPVSIVLPFLVRHEGPRLTTTLVAPLPRTLGALPRVGSFEIDLGRRYVFRGARHSLLSAACSAAPGFSGGYLTIAKANYFFADGRTLGVNSVRGCHVR